MIELASKQPTVSIVMAVHNRADYLPQALASLRWQTLQDWECICVDDGSTDDTPRVLARFAEQDPRFRVVRQEKGGVAAALSRGDSLAQADLVARMDSDDVATPERLAWQVVYLNEHPECVAVGGDVMLIDPRGATIGLSPYAREHEEIERRMLAGRGDTIAHPTLMYRRAAIGQVGTYRVEFEAAHDMDFMTRLTLAGRVANLPEVLLLYRQHGGNFCRTRFTETRRQMLGVVREAHAARGLVTPPHLETTLSRPATQSPLVGKWARRAARNGQFATAWRLLREQLKNSPSWVYSTRITAEVVLRSALALTKTKRDPKVELPDWRAWDCPVLGSPMEESAEAA